MTPCFGLMGGKSPRIRAGPFPCLTQGVATQSVTRRAELKRMLITLLRLPGKRSVRLPGMTWTHSSVAVCYGHGHAESKPSKTLSPDYYLLRMANHSDMPTTRSILPSETLSILRAGPIKAMDVYYASPVGHSTISCMSLLEW